MTGQALGTMLRHPPRYGIGAAAVPFSAKLPAYLRITDIDDSGRYTPSPAVSVDNQHSDAYVLTEGELVVARTGASVGKSYRYRKSDGRLVFAGFLIAVTPDPAKLDPDFLGHYMRSKPYWDWVQTESTRSGQPGINAQQLAALSLELPTINVQRHVAARLSEADDLATSLERLIAKKQAIKQGMMQELLTSRSRLPGFQAPWKLFTLGQVLKVRHGRNQRTVETANGRYPILATGGEIGRTDTPLYTKPSVLIGRKGTIDRPQFQTTPFWTVDTLFYTEISVTNDPLFLYYVFLTIDWRSMNEASGVPSLNASRIEGVEVRLPARDEQAAISAVLGDADAEIEVLTRRLITIRNIKQGMMQELLTGRTRLVSEEVAA